MIWLADLIDAALEHRDQPDEIAKLRRAVQDFAEKFPLPSDI
jgi:glycine/serine hydroxymethyltransferase